MKKRVLVVDLDGTLFKINTFHYFLKYLILHSVKVFNIVLLFKLCFILISRLYVSHARMKYNILMLLRDRKDIDYIKFVNSIVKKKRILPEVYGKDFDIKILATAAPSCYAKIIAKNEKFDLCIGTDFSDSSFNTTFENVKDIKKANVLHYLKTQNINEIDTFITDHIDDLSLIKIAKKNIIVEPDEDLVATLKHNSISFEVIK